MDVRILERNSDLTKVTLLIKGATSAMMNTLRRYMINKTPTMAIESVEIKANNSVMYDEVLAHRLGLIPLRTDLMSYDLKSRCKCEGKGCAKCELKITLKASGPGIVKASQLKPKDPKIKPIYPEMPIVKLLKNQEIELVATAELGVGKVHAKWSPGLVYFKNKPKIEIIKQAECEKIVDACPLSIFEKKNNKVAINQDRQLYCHLCGACMAAAPGAVSVTPEPDSFIMTIESWGQLNAGEIAATACAEFDIRLEDFGKALKTIK